MISQRRPSPRPPPPRPVCQGRNWTSGTPLMEFSLPIQNMQHLDFKASSPNLGLACQRQTKTTKTAYFYAAGIFGTVVFPPVTSNETKPVLFMALGFWFLPFLMQSRRMDPRESGLEELICFETSGRRVRPKPYTDFTSSRTWKE